MRIFLDFLGCRLNEAEIEGWKRAFARRGYPVVERPEDATVCILNSCAVTGEAGRQSRQAARRLHRRNPHAALVLAGCYAQFDRDRAAALPGVMLVLDNREKEHLVERVIQTFDPRGEQKAHTDVTHPLPRTRTRAFVKVQDGCNNHCTFCIVSVLRGAERSRAVPDVVNEINELVAAGYREVVLTGVHLGGYGHDRGISLADLVRAILRETRVERLRLSSLEPWDIPPTFFDLWREGEGRLMPHLHLPLQSGCDATLRRMGRRYTTEEYARLVEWARERIPDVSITTDIIVGFPGEDEEEFAASLAFVEKVGFAHMHIFTYSPREGTPAIRLPGHVETNVKKARSRLMHQVMRRMKEEHLRAYLNDIRPVLYEAVVQEEGDTRTWSGLTDNYLRVWTTVPRGVDLYNRILPTHLTHILEGERLAGTLITATEEEEHERILHLLPHRAG